MFWLNESSLTLPRILDFGRGDTLPVDEAAYELSVVECGGPFTSLVLSWNVDSPPGSSARFEARVRYAPADAEPEAGDWSAWRTFGTWGRGDESLPRSEQGEAQADDPVAVEVDVLKLAPGYHASAFQVRVAMRRGEAAPVVRLLAASTALEGATLAEDKDLPAGRGDLRLPVPPRSQHDEPPELENEVCSPTSLGMVMAYYGVDQPTSSVAAGVFDRAAGIYGNWPFNTAYAAAHGLRAVVRHFQSMGELEEELHAGRPVIVSVAFEEGELPESPTGRTAGHLLVVTGVTEAGDFYVNEPDADPRKNEPLERIYSRANLRRAWLTHGGVGYVISEK